MDNEEIAAKARLAADFMSDLSERIEAREDWITTLHPHDYCIPASLTKTRMLEAIRMERSMLLELYKMVEVDDR